MTDLPQTVHLILDANPLMHFRRPDQVDWSVRLACQSVVLVVTPVLLRELEKQKVANPSRKLRDRAKQAISWLVPLCESAGPVEIRAGMRMEFVRHTPQIDFPQHRLSPLINDDELIAAAIEYRDEHAGDVRILTDDGGLRLKLPAHNIKPVAPGDDLRLPDEPDELEKENAKLRAQLQRAPDLNLAFFDGAMKHELLCLKEQVDTEVPYPVNFLTSGYGYDRYLSEFDEWQERARLSTPFFVELNNRGTAVASNIGIELRGFPEFVKLGDRGSPPAPPDHPHFVAVPLGLDERTPHYEDESVVTFRIPNLVHGRRYESGCTWLRFMHEDVIRGFSCEFRITCQEIIKPITGHLHFSVGEHWKGK